MMAVLRFMLFERQRKNRSEFYRGQLDTEKSKLLTMLNWIASIFVTEPVGDVVATALSAEQGRITFYVAANRGPSRDLDRDNVEIFKQLLRDTIEKTDEESGIQLLSVVAPMVYRRLSRKLDLITKIEKTELPGSRVQDRFNETVDRWTKEGNVEDDPAFLSASQELEPRDGNERLKFLLDRMASTATTDAERGRPKDDMTRRLRFASFTFDARTLLKANFSKASRNANLKATGRFNIQMILFGFRDSDDVYGALRATPPTLSPFSSLGCHSSDVFWEKREVEHLLTVEQELR